MNNKMNIPLSGIIPPLVTPLLDDDVLDVTDTIKSKGISLPDHTHRYTDDGHPAETDPPSA
jgi:hypothetical protein